ncbi:MAG: thiamine pyrophosphate-binding protein [Burkholderiales bacterium]
MSRAKGGNGSAARRKAPAPSTRASVAAIERPEGPLAAAASFGSDVVADAIRATGVPWIALVPGASFRGLHDSLVNYLGNRSPRMLVCLHEEHAVAIAHGYAKATGEPLAVALHSNVGLFHATMAIFNAWCDRMPMLMIGATGPVDAARRRPWIDWIHTARDQGAIVRGYVKWDDQPASAAAAREAVLRAARIACTEPKGPVYVNLDAGMQEARVDAPPAPIDAARYLGAPVPSPDPGALGAAAMLLAKAARPLILMGRVSRDEAAWNARVELAERVGADVLTDLKVGCAFPTDHPLHAHPPAIMPSQDALRAVASADVILSLDWVDLAGTLRAAIGGEPQAKIVQVSLDYAVHNGWSMDHQGHPPVDVHLACSPDAAVPLLLDALPARKPKRPLRKRVPPARALAPGPLTTGHIAAALHEALGTRRVSLAHLPLSWDGASWPFRGPLDFLGSDGGGGVGAGPGLGVGAALALAGRGITTVAVCGDGDFLMGATALWSAVHYGIPLLVVVANNRSYWNDEVHQERVARARERPVGNKWIGQRMEDPAVDLAAMGRAQGATGYGPITSYGALAEALGRAVADVDAGKVAVVDVVVAGGATPASAGKR